MDQFDGITWEFRSEDDPHPRRRLLSCDRRDPIELALGTSGTFSVDITPTSFMSDVMSQRLRLRRFDNPNEEPLFFNLSPPNVVIDFLGDEDGVDGTESIIGLPARTCWTGGGGESSRALDPRRGRGNWNPDEVDLPSLSEALLSMNLGLEGDAYN